MNILIIEDDSLLAENLKRTFDKKIVTNRIKVISNYLEFKRELNIIKSYDIILVDILLGGNEKKTGIDIIEEIRGKSKKIPIVIISGLDNISRIEKGFKSGASDYIVKPFRLKELEIRVLKWFQIYFYTDVGGKNNIKYKGLEFDIAKNEFYYEGKVLNLTKGNKYLLSLFLSRPEILFKESFLIEKIRGDLGNIIDRNLRVNILRLKDMLKHYNLDNRILNVRGEGYMLKKN